MGSTAEHRWRAGQPARRSAAGGDERAARGHLAELVDQRGERAVKRLPRGAVAQNRVELTLLLRERAVIVAERLGERFRVRQRRDRVAEQRLTRDRRRRQRPAKVQRLPDRVRDTGDVDLVHRFDRRHDHAEQRLGTWAHGGGEQVQMAQNAVAGGVVERRPLEPVEHRALNGGVGVAERDRGGRGLVAEQLECAADGLLRRRRQGGREVAGRHIDRRARELVDRERDDRLSGRTEQHPQPVRARHELGGVGASSFHSLVCHAAR